MQMIHQPIHLSEADHLAVSSAVAAAEAQSAGEIVTIIAGESNLGVVQLGGKATVGRGRCRLVLRGTP